MTLISLAWVSTVAAVVIAPVLPQIRQVFHLDPHVDIKLSLVATGPSLLVTLTAVPFGMWADRVGRRRLLLTSLLSYGLAGIASLWLRGLDTIVMSRLLLGLAEAVIMTTGTALIGDFGWRTSFAVCAFGFVRFPCVLMFLWEPTSTPQSSARGSTCPPPSMGCSRRCLLNWWDAEPGC